MSARNRMIAVTLAAAAALAVAQQVPFAPPPSAGPATGPASPATPVAPEAVQPPQAAVPQQPDQPQPPNAPPAQQAPRLSPQELDQLTAPVALYPDALLSQVLMASTYPLEVVQARRWTDANANLTGDPLADALAKLPWDPSVKSLVTTPTVLQMMDDKIEWTVKLGDAFLAQQGEVMDSVQRLRAQAQAAGYLKDTEQQRVTTAPVEPQPAPQPAPQVTYYDNGAPQAQPPVVQYITIEDTQPDYLYVPVYDPVVVYGGWAYSSYRPFFWRPHYYVETRGIWYGRPCHTGPAWNYAWGRTDWAVRRLEFDVARAERAARDARIERDRAYQQLRQREREVAQNRQRERDNDRDRDRDRDRRDARPSQPGRAAQASGAIAWQHDAEHRRGVSYRDAATAQRFATNRPTPTAAARDAARARTDAADNVARDRTNAARAAEQAAANRRSAVNRATGTPPDGTPQTRRPVIPNGNVATPPARPDRNDTPGDNRTRTRPETAERAATPDRGDNNPAATPNGSPSNAGRTGRATENANGNGANGNRPRAGERGDNGNDAKADDKAVSGGSPAAPRPSGGDTPADRGNGGDRGNADRGRDAGPSPAGKSSDPAPAPRTRERAAPAGGGDSDNRGNGSPGNAGQGGGGRGSAQPGPSSPTPAPRQAAPAPSPTPAPRQAAPVPAPTPAPRVAPSPAPTPAPAPAPRQAAPAPSVPAPAPRAVQPAPAPRAEAPARGSAPERPAPAPAAERGDSGSRGGASSGSSGESRGGGGSSGGGRSSGRSK